MIATFDIDPVDIRRDYRLSDPHREQLERGLGQYFREMQRAHMRAGDVLLMSIDNRQLHLGVRTQAGFVHAHAGIRRVVETPGMPQWPLRGVFRRRSQMRQG